MKKQGTLKIILAVLVIVLLCMVSFGGIYWKNNCKNIYENKVNDFKLGMDLGKTTLLKLNVNVKEDNNNNSSNENENNNENNNNGSNENESNNENNNNSSNENESNNENIYTVENYKKSKKIIEERIKDVQIEDYTIRLEETTGSIVLEFAEEVNASTISKLFSKGETEIKVKETNEVIGNNSSIKSIKTKINNEYSRMGQGSLVEIDIEFTNEMKNKLRELKNNYQVPVDEEGKETTNNIEIVIDGTPICSLEELEFINSGINSGLQLNLGGFITDQTVLNSTFEEVNRMKMIAGNEPLPIEYEVDYYNTIDSNISKFAVIAVLAIIILAMFIFLACKYKLFGILSGTTLFGFIATVLLVIRYISDVKITVSAIVAIGLLLALQFMYLIKLLSNKKVNSKLFNEETLEITKMLIPAFIISIIIIAYEGIFQSGVFGKVIEINAFGKIVFWGLILFEVFNNIITRAIFTNAKNK